MWTVVAALVSSAALASDPASTVRWFNPDAPRVAPAAATLQLDPSGTVLPTVDPPQLHTAAAIHVDVVDADIRSVLRLVSHVSGLNFVVPDHVQSTVTAHLQDVPWDLALAAILSAEGLQAVAVSDDVVVIEPISATR